jgi:predicted RNase H-like HicB family nuclease
MKYVVIIEQANDGSFSAYVPDLPGCTTSGDTLDEVRTLIPQAVKLHIESLREHGEPVPPPSSTVDVVEAA